MKNNNEQVQKKKAKKEKVPLLPIQIKIIRIIIGIIIFLVVLGMTLSSLSYYNAI